MLRPRWSSSLVQWSQHHFYVLQVPCRSCSTLGDVRTLLASLRESERFNGGTVQLCITEDLRVFAEHRVTALAGERRRVFPVKTWQGDASTTVEETLRALQSSETTGSPASSSFSPLQHDHHSPPNSAMNATMVDLTHASADEVRLVLRYLEETYPALKLRVRHTSGTDLQGSKLHTIHVELVPRAIRGDAAAPLPDDAQRLVDTFKGESVGEGYNGCLRRALRDAFAAAELSYPSTGGGATDTCTLLSLYAQTWSKDGFQLRVRAIPFSNDSVEWTVRHPAHGQVLGTTTLPLTAAGLRGLLPFCDEVAASYSPVRYTTVRQRIQRSPLHLVLPRTHLRVKALLLKLLSYHYGCTDSDVTFTVHEPSAGVYAANVTVHLSPSHVACDEATAAPLFVVARTSGTSRKKATELAAVEAMQALFPDLFERQIAYHADVRAIQQSDKASASTNMPPHVSRGLEAQLQWAVQSINATFVVESVQLKRSTPYPLWGITTGPSVVWLSQLFLVKAVAADDTAATASPDGAVRELCAHAFDTRKARSEQKVVAATLARHFAAVCAASITDAQERRLIDATGAPAPFEGVQPLQAGETEAFAAALSSDPCLTTLAPTRSSVLQPLPECDVRRSALASCWASVTSHCTAQLTVLVQHTRKDVTAAYTATCVAAGDGAGDVEKLLAEATASTEIAALLTMLEAAQKTLNQHAEKAGKAETGDHGTDDAPQNTLEFLAGVPTVLPTATPLQTCVDAIGRLYGLHCAVRITQDGVQHSAELWGRFPVDSAMLRRYDRVASSPFLLDRNFLLGRGHAESPFMAVVRAAQHVFEVHVRVHQRVFHESVVAEGKLHLHPTEDSALAQLRDAVLREIKATSDKTLTDSALTLHFHHDQLFQFAFTVSSGKQSIKLEETVSHRFLGAVHEFCTRVSSETGMAFLSPARLAAIVVQTPEQALRELCRLAYGFELQVETVQVHQTWHCRLSVPLSGELAGCVAASFAHRKKDAVDVAAMAVLTQHFAAEAAHISSYAAFCSSSRSTNAETDTASANMENYVFAVSGSHDESADSASPL